MFQSILVLVARLEFIRLVGRKTGPWRDQLHYHRGRDGPFQRRPATLDVFAAHATVGRQMPLMICHWAPGFAIWASKRASVDVRDIAGTGAWVWVGFLAWSILLTEETMEPTWKKECCDSVSPEQMMLVGFCNFPRNILSTQNFGMSKIIVWSH